MRILITHMFASNRTPLSLTDSLRNLATYAYSPDNAHPNGSLISETKRHPCEISGASLGIVRRDIVGEQTSFLVLVTADKSESTRTLNTEQPKEVVFTETGPEIQKRNTELLARQKSPSSAELHAHENIGHISKDFLRAFSRAIAREKAGDSNFEATKNVLPSFAGEKISFKCTAEVEKTQSKAKIDLTRQFDLSLPLPNANHMIRPISVMSSGTPKNLPVRQDYNFMKYLDHATAGGSVFQKDYKSVFESSVSTTRSRQEPHFFSDSATEYSAIILGCERPIFNVQLVVAIKPQLHSSRTLPIFFGSSSDEAAALCRPFMDYDDQVSIKFNPLSSHCSSGASGPLSSTFSKSLYVLKKTKPVSPKIERAEESPCTPKRPLDSENIITTPKSNKRGIEKRIRGEMRNWPASSKLSNSVNIDCDFDKKEFTSTERT